MNTKQLKINVPVSLHKVIKDRANRWGLTMASYVKYLMLNEAKSDYPSFEVSDKVKKMIREIESGKEKTVKVEKLADFFDKL